jgi:hypothetical protein
MYSWEGSKVQAPISQGDADEYFVDIAKANIGEY